VADRVIAGHDEPGNQAGIAALGASVYLTKPVDEALLLEAILRTLKGSVPESRNSVKGSGNDVGLETRQRFSEPRFAQRGTLGVAEVRTIDD